MIQKSIEEEQGKLDSMAKGLGVLYPLSFLLLTSEHVKLRSISVSWKLKAQACSGLAKIGFTKRRENSNL